MQACTGEKVHQNQMLFPEIHVFAFPFNYISKSYPPPKTLKYSYHEALSKTATK